MTAIFPVHFRKTLALIELPPRIDARNARALLAVVESAARRGYSAVVLDFGRTRSLDGSGIGVLTYLFQSLRNRDIELLLAGLAPRLGAFFEGTALRDARKLAWSEPTTERADEPPQSPCARIDGDHGSTPASSRRLHTSDRERNEHAMV